jgi:hypothetical protein
MFYFVWLWIDNLCFYPLLLSSSIEIRFPHLGFYPYREGQLYLTLQVEGEDDEEEEGKKKGWKKKATTKVWAREPVVVQTVNIGDGGTTSRLNDDAIGMFGMTMTKKKAKKRVPLLQLHVGDLQNPPPLHPFVAYEEWFSLLDVLLDKNESAITAGRTTPLCLWGVLWNFQNQNHIINNLITTLLCGLDVIDIPQRAVYLRLQQKQSIKRIEGLNVLRKNHRQISRNNSSVNRLLVS